ncbi:MAG: tripartite tricarboxylate transporter substrate binding protein [Acetobacteraceae bacterium]|nr:tripartite tricarboxylate transporter substrate binding protein [Acetobacteraceae bacterium]MCX7684122.1 tripartite tricarboxylate transporter substrate binding protein [Acetobacteraceae bacterium]MDW8398699.1 tripartite tricarboxylate transporter substrate binding protein [Acetobacteraceae bacterium]
MLARRTILAAPALLALPAAAQPATLRIIVPAPPGGPTDILARVVGERMAATLSRPVVIDNRAGAGGVIGTEAAARSAADGNTLVLGHNQTHASNQWMMPRLPYHVRDSFVAVARLASVHHCLVVPGSSPFATLADLIAAGRQRELAYASSQAGSASHVISETLVRRNGMRAMHVPYNGAAPAATATVAGQVDFYTSTFPTVAGLLREGRLRGLAVGAPARLPDFPAIPTAAEAGQPEPFVDAWFGLFAPAGTPAAAVAALAEAALAALREEAAAERLRNAGFTLTPQGPAEFAAFQESEIARWQEMIRLTGVRLES